MAVKQNANQAAYQEPILIEGAQVGPRLISATETLAAFSLAEPQELIAALAVHEYLTTALAGDDNDLTFFAKRGGDQAVTIAYIDPGGVTSSLEVAVVDSGIVVTLARAASAIITTAAQLKTAVEADADAAALVTVALAAGSDGTGIVTALAETALGGPAGTNSTLDVELHSGIDGVQFGPINATFTQKTAAAVVELGIFGNLGTWGQYVVTVGGTDSPEFAFSLATMFKP